MGLFSRKWVTTVSSTAYNMAGDIDLRPNVIQSALVGHVLRGEDRSIGSTLQHMAAQGSAMTQRRFFNWAKNNYIHGISTAGITAEITVDTTTVRAGLLPILSLGSNQTLFVDEAVIDIGNADFWAIRWIEENHPDITDDAWIYSYDRLTDEIVIEVDGFGETRLAADADLIWAKDRSENRKLLYVSYTILTESGGVLTTTDDTYFTYRMGSGNVTFDSLMDTEDDGGEFFPAIPIRLENKSIDHVDYADDYDGVSKAFKKMTGTKIDEILPTINDHEDVGDMDHVFAITGVALNTPDHAAQEYLYRFFEFLRPNTRNSKQDFLNYQSYIRGRSSEAVTWERWQAGFTSEYHPMSGEAVPAQPSVTGAPTLTQTQIRMDALPEFNFVLKWAYIKETLHEGNARTFDGQDPESRGGLLGIGKYWMHLGSPLDLSWTTTKPVGAHDEWTPITRGSSYDRIYVFKQTGRYSYTKLEICGLSHENYVYGSHAVRITASEAMNDTEETGFIIPLHYPTLKSLGLVKATQFTTANTYLVINSYDRRKQKWYETGIFKIILVIVSIVLSVVTGGGSLGAASGLLGTNAAVGAAIVGAGASITTTAIVGAIANQIAAMVLSTIVLKGATALFGEKIGAIVGVIAMFMAGHVSQSIQAGNGFSVDWGRIMDVNNLTKLTSTMTDTYAKFLNLDTQDIFARMEALAEEHEEKFDDLNEMSESILGMTNVTIDPIIFTDIPEHLGESRESFLTRTLLTGHDLAELSLGFVENFVEFSLELPHPTR